MSDRHNLDITIGEGFAAPRQESEHHQTDGPAPAKDGLCSRINAALLAWGRWMDGRGVPAGFGEGEEGV